MNFWFDTVIDVHSIEKEYVAFERVSQSPQGKNVADWKLGTNNAESLIKTQTL